MTDHSTQAAEREQAARHAIKNGFDMDDEDSGVAMFVAFHLEELDAAYWQQHLGTARPMPDAVLDALVLRERWGGAGDLEHFDFTLPGDITDYVIGVRFDAAGKVAEVSMES